MLGFGSLLHTANGKAVSPVGTFGTSKRKNDLRLMCGADTFYAPHDGMEAIVQSSKGVWRTEKRFTPLVEDSSPGPIYKIPEDLTKQKGLSWGKPPPKPTPLPKLKDANTSSSLLQPTINNNNTSLARNKSPSRCTFGTPHYRAPSLPAAATDASSHRRGSSNKDGAASTTAEGVSHAASSSFALPPSIQSYIPPYRGRWGSPSKKPSVDEAEEKRRRKKDMELLNILKQGFIQQQTYRSSTPSFSMGTRAAAIPPRTITPGPNAYNISKYKPDGKPTCPTFVGKGHDMLEFQAGRDSPGPALYAQMRYP